MAKLVGGTSLSLFIVPFKSFQASRHQTNTSCGKSQFLGKEQFPTSGKKKTLIWQGLAEMSARDLCALRAYNFHSIFHCRILI